MKKGKKITLYFHGAGTVSKEKRTVIDFTDAVITTNETIHPDNGHGEENERFDRKTGKCLNDNTMFGFKRTIDPQ
jgi:hypothetical protein